MIHIDTGFRTFWWISWISIFRPTDRSTYAFVGVQTVGRKTSWAKDVWANYFLGDRRLGDNSHLKKDVLRKTVGRQRPKQFASQRSTLVRNSAVRATIKVNGKPPILG